jgi:hypothetical protein
VDNWNFKQFEKMPDVILKRLGKLLARSQRSMTMPVQTYLNLLASIPKSQGGNRTVGIASSFYRLLMALDNTRVAAFEKENAYCNDSAAAGASALLAAEDRALEAELEAALGNPTFTILWDFAKFFDSVDLGILIEEAVIVGFR